MDTLSLIFAFLQIVGFALLAWRLNHLHLSGFFRYFTLFCLFEPFRILIALAIPPKSNTYAQYYFATQPVVWTFYALITLEVFRSAFAGHHGIYTASRKALNWCLAGALLVAAATAGIDLAEGAVRYPSLEFFLVADRTVTFSLLAFIVALMLTLAWFPVPLNKNVLLHTVVLTFFFAAKAALLFSRNLFGPEFTRPVNVGLLSAFVACLAAWSTLLVSSERAQIVRSGIERTPEAEARLLAQLNAINETLTGTFRK